MIVTHSLARRLEVAEALDGVACAQACVLLNPECGSNVKAVAGGFCLFCGEASPLTHALGIGLHGPVTLEEVLAIEDFFHSRGAPVAIDVSPYADPSLRDLLTARGYAIADFNTVLMRALHREEVLPAARPGVTVRPAEPADMGLYVRTTVGGFLGREELTEEEIRLGQTLFHMPGGTSFLAALGPEVAGGCNMMIREGVASLFADATLPCFRGQGVHSSMILERLRRAAEAGAELATAGTQPGSTSQRNYQRLGFEVAYSKLTMMRE